MLLSQQKKTEDSNSKIGIKMIVANISSFIFKSLLFQSLKKYNSFALNQNFELFFTQVISKKGFILITAKLEVASIGKTIIQLANVMTIMIVNK